MHSAFGIPLHLKPFNTFITTTALEAVLHPCNRHRA